MNAHTFTFIHNFCQMRSPPCSIHDHLNGRNLAQNKQNKNGNQFCSERKFAKEQKGKIVKLES